MTQLYLIRHGIAADRSEYARDGDRPLTDAGRQKTQKIARRLAKLGLRFDVLLSSPLVRAWQTAEILQAAGLCGAIARFEPLAPGGDVADWVAWWGDRANADLETIAVVGHEPDLGHWAERLVWGEARGMLVVKKAGAIGVELPQAGNPIARCELFWLTPPRLLLP